MADSVRQPVWSCATLSAPTQTSHTVAPNRDASFLLHSIVILILINPVIILILINRWLLGLIYNSNLGQPVMSVWIYNYIIKRAAVVLVVA